MPPSSRSSGNLLADRRFAYAQGLLDDGDPAGAADLLEQTLALAPDWVPAWMALGAARERAGEGTAAEAALARADALDTTGVYGAGLHMARLRGDPSPPAMPERFVAALFDDYAPRFDRHLVEDLGYRGPALLLAVVMATRPGRFERCLDLGCGTGLMGAAIRPRVSFLEGVDLSPAMIAVARQGGHYDTLAVGEIHRALDARAEGTFDLMLAADVFAYIGSIEVTLASVARVLAPGGLAAFTVQHGTAVPWRLGQDMRFSHAASFVEDAVAAAGLKLASMAEASTRHDAGADVPGLVVVALKP